VKCFEPTGSSSGHIHTGYANYPVPMTDVFLKYYTNLLIIVGNYIIVNKSYIIK